ncbi:restriction endonuclease [Luteibacter sp. dw_328]|uniref:restriction endonuclease n=1 Tax=Luteibacter sp. dw_328 TaxID=2719796 RepID=UPI001BD39696|nr:restriction endonuclease [Luteibacter sp. dw_328]
MFSARQPSAGGTDALARLTWQDFEHLLAEHYRAQGYRVEHHAPVTSLKALAAGVDLRLTRGNESVILQCKHWDALEVEVQEVNELLSVMLNEAATKGILVTRGRFSAEAINIQRRQPRLQLMDGDVLRVLLKLPEHLDTSLPGSAAAAPTKKSAKAARRRGTSSQGSHLLPALLVLGIVILLGLFGWKVMSRRDAVAEAPPPVDTPAATPAASRAPIPDLPPAPPPPLSGASGIVSVPPSSSLPPPPTRELQERQRVLEQSERERASQRKNEDGLKVLEKNTRELGSHD